LNLKEEKMSEPKKEKKETESPFKQPFYCHLKNGKWDRKFRDKNGKVIE